MNVVLQTAETDRARVWIGETVEAVKSRVETRDPSRNCPTRADLTVSLQRKRPVELSDTLTIFVPSCS